MQPVADLTALNEAYIRAVQDGDVGWFDRHLTADFLNTAPDGTLADKPGFLAMIGRPPGITGLRCEDVRIRLFGDCAIIHAATVYARADGTPGRGRYTDIWVRQDGAWHCAAAHVTRL